jgi:hypothetical protein
MSLEDRIRRLEERMARLAVPSSLDEVGAAFGRVTERAWARVRGEPSVPYEDRRQQDRGIIERWAEAEGVDLEGEAERAKEKQKLMNVDRARS